MPITSSSTSSSERAGEAAWTGFIRRFAGAAAAALALLLGAAVALDPYDTGRFALLRTPGLSEQGPRTANASRGRDPAFDGAIIGNSHIQLVEPAALERETGIAFVSLIVPATGAAEQLHLLDYWLRNRRRPPRALVIGADDYWCTDDPAGRHHQPFPFWLYDPSPWTYLGGLLRDSTFDAALRRIQYAAGLSARPRARPDGYWSYELHRSWDAERNGRELARPLPSPFVGLSGRFPRIAELGTRLAQLPPVTATILVRPPVYPTALPAPGTALAAAEDGCRDALQALVGPRVGLIDRRLDRPENRDPANFFDHSHYRGPLARALERDIAESLAVLRGRMSP